MKQQSHSPGPWTVTRNDLGGYVILDAAGCVVAEIDGPYTPSYDRYAADAALIAGSPGLLEACHVAAAFLEDTEDGEPLSGDEVLAVLCRAIEQAKVKVDEQEEE